LRALPGGAAVAEGPSDDELIDAVVRGDDRVADLLYDRVIGVVDRTLFRIFGRREHDHDDIVQNTFEQIVVTLCRQRFARACSLTTWAATVATNVGLNSLRSRRRERRVVDRSESVDEAGPRSTSGEAAVEARFELERVRTHLAAMDPNKAETLFLHDALGHDLAEIAVITGVSVAAAQSRLVRGRKELVARLDRRTPSEASASGVSSRGCRGAEPHDGDGGRR
jgi:RNA polymerase sigma-70 factor (ECF subfamily)